MKNSVSSNEEQIKNNSGIKYIQSGNLFIVKSVCNLAPKIFDQCRGKVVGFSPSSGRRMRRYLRECTSNYVHMVTLTYPGEYPSDGAAVKEHLRRFLQEVRREVARSSFILSGTKPFSAFWFLEFQARGAPHFHIFLNYCPDKDWVASQWYEIVNSEDIRHFHAGTRTELLRHGRAGTISYASKYANKCEQKVVPEGYENVGRFWGVCGSRHCLSADAYVTHAEAETISVKCAVKGVVRRAEKLLSEGKARVFKRETGLFIMIVDDPNDQNELMRIIGYLETKVTHRFDYFECAEIDLCE